MHYLSSLECCFVSFGTIHYLPGQIDQYFVDCSSQFPHRYFSVHLNKYDAYKDYCFVTAKDQQFFNKFLFYFHYMIYYITSIQILQFHFILNLHLYSQGIYREFYHNYQNLLFYFELQVVSSIQHHFLQYFIQILLEQKALQIFHLKKLLLSFD